MSSKIMGKVWDLDLPHSHQSVLLALADHANHEGGDVFPSTGLVAWKTGYSHRQTQRIMDALESDGLIVRVADPTFRRATEYRIELEAGTIKEPYDPGPRTQGKHGKGGVKMSPREGCQDVTPTLPGMSPHGVTSEPIGGDIAMSPEPSKEPSKEPSATPEAPSASGGGDSEQGSVGFQFRGERAPRPGWQAADREPTANGRGRRRRNGRERQKVAMPAARPEPEQVVDLNGQQERADADWQRVLAVVREHAEASVVAIWLEPLTVAGRGPDGELVLTGDPAKMGWTADRFGRTVTETGAHLGVKIRIARHGAVVSEVRPAVAG